MECVKCRRQVTERHLYGQPFTTLADDSEALPEICDAGGLHEAEGTPSWMDDSCPRCPNCGGHAHGDCDGPEWGTYYPDPYNPNEAQP